MSAIERDHTQPDCKARAESVEQNGAERTENSVVEQRVRIFSYLLSFDCPESELERLRAEIETLRAEVSRMGAEQAQSSTELGCLRAELASERVHAKFASDEHGKADAECETLRAENERLQAMLDHAHEISMQHVEVALDAESRRAAVESRLAEAIGFLNVIYHHYAAYLPYQRGELREFLAAEHAASRGRKR